MKIQILVREKIMLIIIKQKFHYQVREESYLFFFLQERTNDK